MERYTTCTNHNDIHSHWQGTWQSISSGHMYILVYVLVVGVEIIRASISYDGQVL